MVRGQATDRPSHYWPEVSYTSRDRDLTVDADVACWNGSASRNIPTRNRVTSRAFAVLASTLCGTRAVCACWYVNRPCNTRQQHDDGDGRTDRHATAAHERTHAISHR